MTILHSTFHLDNISFYDSLERVDKKIIASFYDTKSKNSINKSIYKEIIEHLDFKRQIVLNKKFEKIIMFLK